MTLEGTNTWVLRGPRSDELVIVDPGPGRRRAHRPGRRAGPHRAGADQPPARRPHRRHRQAGRADRRTGACGGSSSSCAATAVTLTDRRGDRRGRPEDHGAGHSRPHRRLAVVRARRRRADRRQCAGPRHHRPRQGRRQPDATTWSHCSGCAVWAAGRCCPGTARIWPTWTAVALRAI